MGAAGPRCIQGLMRHGDGEVKVRWHEFVVNPGSKVACLWWKSSEEFDVYWARFFPIVI